MFDICFSIFLLIIILLPIFIIFFLILSIDKHNPIFTQIRTGYKKSHFKIFKFKTMKGDKVTTLGNFLRKYKIDEFPQIINVLINDMSFVGPRPLPISYDEYFSDKISKRFLVMPGITGLSQIKILDNGLWRRKFRYDIIYYKRASFLLDIFILCRTINIIYGILRKKITFEENHTPLV